MNRREFMQVLAAGASAGMALDSAAALAQHDGESLYELPRFGDLSFLHFTDCHAQLAPVYYREPSMNIGVGVAAGRPPHLVGEHLLRAFNIDARTIAAHAFTHLDFEQAARAYGRVGGFAHLASLIKRLRASRPHALLLDGGDTWQGSGLALWTKGQDMVDAAKLLGVDIMTGHWEFTLGAERVKQIVEKDFAGRVEFLAQNVRTTDFGDRVFKPYVIRELNGIAVAVVGQAYPYTPIANPRYFVPEWTFGIQEDALQRLVDEARGKGAQVVIALSHNGVDVDLKMASRVTGIDAVLGGHTHDGMPAPAVVKNARGQTLVTNGGSNGKFLGVLDLRVKGGRVVDYRYRLMPVFANLLPADRDMQTYIDRVRAPFKSKLEEVVAVSESLLYRRGNFNGTFDQLILDALMTVKGAEIAFSPGFRWGTTVLSGEPITRERVLGQTAITYPHTTLTAMTGATIKTILEDVCDNLFNPDPYYQQGGDMVRVGGLQYTCDPTAKIGQRIVDLRLAGKPLAADKTYKVASWAPVAEGAQGEPIWEVLEQYLRAAKSVKPPTLNLPKLVGMAGNPGIA